jgi:serine/threonine-protein kinase
VSSSGGPDPSRIAGRFTIETRLGAGAFGTVYKARDEVLGRTVAIKTIRLEVLAASANRGALTRFLREAQVSAQLRHPNIVTVFDVGEAEGVSYLAMEFLDGSSLDKLLELERRLSPIRAAVIGTQVALALAHAHRAGVVHRDVKPANIIVEDADRVKVTDFGIAMATYVEQQSTAIGGLLGTPSYMSPEQARGDDLDGRSDIFSLGAVLYEMLTGTRAFRGDSITSLIFKVITEQPVPVHNLVSDVPEGVEAIVARALAKAREERYQDAEELARALRAFVPTSGDLTRAAPGGPRFKS